MDNNNIWDNFLENIKGKVSTPAYETWFLPFSIYKIDEDGSIIYLTTKEEIALRQFKARYLTLSEESFEEVLGKKYRVVAKLLSEIKKEEKPKTVSPRKFGNDKLFNPRLTFENFVVGDNNKLAHAASLAVAESPAEAYNPLFLYGGSGLGKTHLMQAIGIYAIQHHPGINVLYVSSEMFTNEFISCVSNNKMRTFKNKYRKVDILLIDDIQFLEDKEQTQEEFFYTFQSLYENDKQIVISSDRPPNRLTKLDERLRSRFAWNMTADLQPADYETRVAILQKKVQNAGLDYDEDMQEVCAFIADQVRDNIRDLEGALNRVIGASNLLQEKIDLDLAKRSLQELVIANEQGMAPERIKSIVAKYYKIKVADMDSKKRNANIAFPRQVAMYLVRQNTDLSLPKIGKLFGGRHYSTVIHSNEKIEELYRTDPSFRQDLDNIKEKINSR